ncbi:MAG: hypothetical protein ACOZIN_04820 [Myxococcota bacterium]
MSATSVASLYVECASCHIQMSAQREFCPVCLGSMTSAPRCVDSPTSATSVPCAKAAAGASSGVASTEKRSDSAQLRPVVPSEPEERDLGERPLMMDLILRGRKRLNRLLCDDHQLPSALQRLLLLSLAGLLVHGLVVGFAAQVLEVSLFGGHPVLWMPLASMVSFLGALCVCLPSFYFYTQLSGLDASFRLVTGQALRAQATTSVLLLGALPFYVAWVLSCVLGLYSDAETVVQVGLFLPFGVGLFGVHALYRAFCDLAEHLPITHRRRGNFLRRMVLAWGAVYTVVAPVMLYRVSQGLSAVL